MKRKVYAKQMDKDKRQKDSGNMEINDDTEGTPEPQPIASPAAAAESPRNQTTPTASMSRNTPTVSFNGPLPNVNVLMKGGLRVLQGEGQFANNEETFASSVCVNPSFQQEHEENKDTTSSVSENVHTKLKDQSVVWHDVRTALTSEEDVSYSSVGPASFQTNAVFGNPHSLQNDVMVNNSPYHETRQRETHMSMKSMLDQNRGKYHSNDERGTFTEQKNVINQQRDIHGIPMIHDSQQAPVIMPTKDGPMYVQSIPDHLQMQQFQRLNQMRPWEQENYRYVDYPWRSQESASTDSIYDRNDKDDIDVDNAYDDKNVMLGSSHYNNESEDAINSNSNDENTNDSVVKQNGERFAHSQKISSHTAPHGFPVRRRRKRVQTPIQRSAANMRERRRMCHLNVAFDRLKEHLPNVKDKKKLSRIQTLKAAIFYIHLLQDSLNVC